MQQPVTLNLLVNLTVDDQNCKDLLGDLGNKILGIKGQGYQLHDVKYVMQTEQNYQVVRIDPKLPMDSNKDRWLD